MTHPLFVFGTLDDGEAFCVCGRPASFHIAVVPVAADYKFCGPCAVAFVLQTLKNAGVDLEEICAVFPRLSAAVDAPPESPLVM